MRQSGFNPKARWDRHVPEDASESGLLNEKIEVLVWFKNAKIYPRIFFWKDKKYKIKKITYNWQERRGQETLNYFSVDAEAGLYQISFNSVTFGWRIDKVIE